MVGMADHAATTAARAGEDGVVDALFVKLLKQHVAGSANRGHGFHLRWLGAVVAVTGGAGGGGEIVSFGEPFPMDAGLVFLELIRSEEHTSELQSLRHLVCRLLLEKKK